MRRFQRSRTTGLLGAIFWFQMLRSSGTGLNLGKVTQTHSWTTKLKSWEWATWVSMLTHLPDRHPSLCLFITTWLPWPSAASTHHGSPLVPVQALDGQPSAYSDCPPAPPPPCCLLSAYSDLPLPFGALHLLTALRVAILSALLTHGLKPLTSLTTQLLSGAAKI